MNDYILIRKSSVKTSDKNVLTSTHCPGCGAPESRSENGYCEYCQTPLNDGSFGWVLNEIRRFSGYPDAPTRYSQLKHEPPPNPLTTHYLSNIDAEDLVACTVGVMLADGEIDPKEQVLLQNMAESKGVGKDKLNSIINTVKTEGIHIPNPDSPEVAKEFLTCMVHMCLSDGKVTSSEKDLMKQLVEKMGYSAIDIDQMIKQERRRVYQNAKEILKT